MTEIMKQRLIGALMLLAAIGAIALFLISNTSHDKNEQTDVVEQSEFFSSVEPLVQTIEVDQEILLDPHELEKQENNDTVDETITDTLSAPEKITSPISSWIIQVGSFSVQKNAEALHEKLSKLGFNSKVEQNKNNYRVRISPDNNKQDVDEIVKKISNKLGIKAQVLSVTE